ncbi:cobalt-precorrin 4 C11-methyltransferase [Lachnospiraceae bacterium C7]|nr:cobalt-precorrin 4 C11-methyltransferase [Lachnospiraceae bacterium C7]
MIHFVGAGTGAADLITVRGKKLLEETDVIIYAGSLVNKELLSYKKVECQVYNSAKMTLDEVIDVMKDANKKGQDVVRLHTGDPCVYGAVREQMDELDKLAIKYDSCPGVSACFGAAAQMNVEYTLPNISQSLIITRMEGRTKVPPLESIESFAAHQATMAIYLSTGMLEELVKRLIKGGYKKETPVALAYKVTWPDEKIYRCTLENVVEIANKNNITKTALVIVGDALGYTEYEKSRLYAPDFSTEYRKAKE